MTAVVSACGLLLMTSFGVMLTVVRRWRRLKREGDHNEVAGAGIQLDDLVKLLCYTGWRRRLRGTPARDAKPPNAGPTGTTGVAQQVPGVVIYLSTQIFK